MVLQLTSSAFLDGNSIPDRYTRLGDNYSPPLRWSDAPETTRSFALVVEDPDAPNGTFRHWAIYDIPHGRNGLEEGASAATDLPQATNDFGEARYDGPQPPAGHGPHRYRFKLMALDVEALEVPPDADVAGVRDAATPHVVAETDLVGLYEQA